MNGVAQTMNCEGAQIKIQQRANALSFFRIEVRTSRRGPLGSTLSVWQPHGINSYWRMYWDGSPIVCGHDDPGVFDTPFEAIGVLERFAGDEMRSVLFD
jgi:hypothetical protein